MLAGSGGFGGSLGGVGGLLSVPTCFCFVIQVGLRLCRWALGFVGGPEAL